MGGWETLGKRALFIEVFSKKLHPKINIYVNTSVKSRKKEAKNITFAAEEAWSADVFPSLPVRFISGAESIPPPLPKDKTEIH